MHFGPNLAILRPKILIITGGSKSFGTHVTEPCLHCFLVEHGTKWANIWPKLPILGQIWQVLGQRSIFRGAKMCHFHRKIWIFGAKSQFFGLESRFLLTGFITITPGNTTFQFRPTRKKFHFPSYWPFSGADPRFWPFRVCVTSLLYVSTLNFRPPSTKLGGTVRVIKKMTHNDNGPEKTLETLRIEWSTCLLVLLHV